MNIFKSLICKVKGHKIDRSTSILEEDFPMMRNKRNWLCECKRCHAYIMHDGAGSGMTITLTKKEAYKIKSDFERDMMQIIGSQLEKGIREGISKGEKA